MRGFTTTYNGISNILQNNVFVLNNIGDNKIKREYRAIWDTGATNTAISEKVVQECNLIPISKQKVSTASGISIANVYVVDLILPDDVKINNLTVTEAKLNGEDLLIGMDIMNKGDFSVSNFKGQTKFTFRIPSLEHSDYVKQRTLHAENKPLRNSKCPCGSGKKYKNCCGKNG